MTTWHLLLGCPGALRSTVDGVLVWVTPSRLGGWSYHWMPEDSAMESGYAPTLEAAQTMAEAAARGEL